MEISAAQECASQIYNSGDMLKVEVDFLPSGEFIYPILFSNPFGQETECEVHVISDSQDEKQVVIQKFSDTSYRVDFSFTVKNISERQRFWISILIKKGKSLKIQVPFTPRKKSPIQPMNINFYPLTEKINSDINDWVNDIEPRSADSGATITSDKSTLSMNKRQIDSHIQSRFFRGLLSLDEAQRQLDFVIYEKIFNPAGEQGFRKWRKFFWRRLVVFFYKILTKNPARKLYFAKLYRNYVNSNLIAENLHGE